MAYTRKNGKSSKKSKSYTQGDDHTPLGEKAVQNFTQMILTRMEAMKASDWQQGWTGANGQAMGFPQNLSGRTYSGTNAFFLQMDSAAKGYKTPVYLTMHQANEQKLRIKKGSTAMPVIYWDITIKDAKDNKVSKDDYRNMTKSEQDQCTIGTFLKGYYVFNIDQTNMETAKKEKYDSIVDRFKAHEIIGKEGMYENAAIDRMIDKDEWLCHIQADKLSDGAFYNRVKDTVIVPMKEQFNKGSTQEEIYKDGMEFYSSLLHEMAHSTGSEDRLNRVKGQRFGDPKYAKEELIAELTAALVGNAMGFDKRILDNNAAYVDGWIDVLKQEPRFIVSVMSEVNKASNMILEEVDKQRIALGERPVKANYVTENVEKPEEAAVMAKKVSQVSIINDYLDPTKPLRPIEDYFEPRLHKDYHGNWHLTMSTKGTHKDLADAKPITHEEAFRCTSTRYPDTPWDCANKHFASEIEAFNTGKFKLIAANSRSRGYSSQMSR